MVAKPEYPKLNREQREHVKLLRKRIRHLQARVAVNKANGSGYSWDQRERRALEWALSEIKSKHPEVGLIFWDSKLGEQNGTEQDTTSLGTSEGNPTCGETADAVQNDINR